MTLITEIQYIPSSIIINALGKFTNYRLEQYERYQKMSFRNRMVVAGAEGPVNLSIPLANGRNQNCPIREVRICYRENWQLAHWRTISSCYNRSPWFEYFRDELEKIYQRRIIFLFDWNLECLNWVFQKLELRVPISLTESYQARYEGPEFKDWRNKLLPKTISGFATDAPIYTQVFQERTGFIPGLSVLDYLFCSGKIK